MTEHCETCKHWLTVDIETRTVDNPVPSLADPDGPTYWSEEKAPGRWGWCQRVAFMSPSKAGKFYVIDGSQYTASLGTREDFGCTEHEAKKAHDG